MNDQVITRKRRAGSFFWDLRS